MNIARTVDEVQRDRIYSSLYEKLAESIEAAGFMVGSGGIPSPRMISALAVEPISIDPADAARLLELLDTLESLHAKAVALDQAYLDQHARISSAENAFRNPRIKGSGAKAAAACRAMGLAARDPDKWGEMYRYYASLCNVYASKLEALQAVADYYQKTLAAVHQGLKRERMRMVAAGADVPVKLPRLP